MKSAQKGFTLVEIAIVLVIIGLLLGGILKGQEMITQAKIKNVIADVTGRLGRRCTATRTATARCPATTRARGAGPVRLPGIGNGVIEGTYQSATATHESRLFWDHLRRAGFVSGSGDENPFNAVSGKTGVQTGDGSGATPGGVLGTAATTQLITGLVLCTANLPDKIAISVDSQMDDGKGKAGGVRGKKGGANPALVVDESADEYAEDGVSTYVVCRQM